jgi:hypothetical protein
LSISGNFSTPNPPVGAWITYHVKDSIPADSKLVLTISDNTGRQVRRCELDPTVGLRRLTWNLNSDPVAVAGGAGPGGGRAGGAAGGGAGGAPAAAASDSTPRTAVALQSCAISTTPGGFGGGAGGGAAFRGAPQRVPAGVYRASIGMMTGTTVTPMGPTQSFSVLPLLQ